MTRIVESAVKIQTSSESNFSPLPPPRSKPEAWWTLAGNTWVIFDLDGTCEAASPRAFPQSEDLPPP